MSKQTRRFVSTPATRRITAEDRLVDIVRAAAKLRKAVAGFERARGNLASNGELEDFDTAVSAGTLRSSVVGEIAADAAEIFAALAAAEAVSE